MEEHSQKELMVQEHYTWGPKITCTNGEPCYAQVSEMRMGAEWRRSTGFTSPQDVFSWGFTECTRE